MSTMKIHNRLIVSFAALLAVLPVHADLVLFPTRVVIEGNQRAAQVELVNSGSQPETYRIEIVNRRMTETGDIVAADDVQPGEQPLGDMIRYSPRQVTLQPGVSQVVRITVRKPANLAAGEYRSHLQFDRVPDAEGQSSLESAAKPQPGQIAIVLQALVGASIPLIVRHGQTSANATVTGLALSAGPDGTPSLAFEIRRSGNASVYGDVRASYTPRGGGRPVELARVDGVAVYVPNPLRKATLALKPPAGTALQGGTLHLAFMARPEAGGKPMAEADLALP
jgi:P pilus assembly chaperone PapD